MLGLAYVARSALLQADSRARPDQRLEALHRLMRAPGDPAQQEQAEERVVEAPGVVARDADEDAALAVLAGPDQGLRLPLLDAARQQRHIRRIAGEAPVALVDQLQLRQAAGDRVFGERQVERPVAELRRAALPCEADQVRERLDVAMP